MNDWKKSWKSSTKPGKQRKYRANAPYHIRKNFLSAKLDSSLEESVGTTSLPVREGDEAQIMRGDFSDMSGRVEIVDREDYKIYINDIERERVDGTDAMVPIDPSNVKLVKLNLDDEKRLKKYEVSEEEKEKIKAETEPEEDEEDEEETEDDESEEESSDTESSEEVQDEADEDGSETEKDNEEKEGDK